MSLKLRSVRPWIVRAILLRFQIILGAVFFGFPFFARGSGKQLFGNLFVIGPFAQFTVALTALVVSWVFVVTTALVAWHGGARIDFPVDLSFPQKWRDSFWRVRGIVAFALASPTLAAVFIASGDHLAADGPLTHLADLGKRTSALAGGFLAAIAVLYLSGIVEAWVTPRGRPRSKLFPVLPMWTRKLHSASPPRWEVRTLALLQSLYKSPGFGPGYLNGEGEIGRGHALSFGFTVLSAILYLTYGMINIPKWAPKGMPALEGVLLVFLFLAWALPVLAFFLDRFRVPVALCALGVSVVLFHLPGNDHFFSLLPATDQSPEAPHDLEEFRRLLVTGGPGEPVVVAMAAGGGITSAAWTAKVLSELAKDERTGESFVRDLKLVSAVSGGAVGTMFFVDRLPADARRLTSEEANEVWKSATDSSLEHIAWGMAYPDLLRGVFPWPFIGLRRLDRSWALERSWRMRLSQRDSTPTLGSWRRDVLNGKKPLVIFNATVAETGDRFQFATLALGKRKVPNQDPATKTRCCEFFAEYGGHDLAIPTAARLSSTFPFVSTAARADGDIPGLPVVHFVDGGYYDNSGVLSALELLDQAFEDSQWRRSQLVNRPIFLLVLRVFDPDKKPLYEEEAGDSWSTAFLSPVSTVVKVRTTTQAARNSWEINQFVGRWNAADFPVTMVDVPLGEISPLSWHLTEKEKSRIEKYWMKAAAPGGAIERFRDALARVPVAASKPPQVVPVNSAVLVLPKSATENEAQEAELPIAWIERMGVEVLGIDLARLRTQWTVGLLVIFALIVAWRLERQWQPLRATVPKSVVDWELAFTKKRAEALFSSWSRQRSPSNVRKILRRQVGLDFLFIPAYSMALSALCWASGYHHQVKNPESGLALDLAALAILPLVAGCLDFGENVCLLLSLRASGRTQPWQALAGSAAAVKFLMLAVTSLGLLGAWLLA